ncbi:MULTISPECIES: hypothetical protein [Arthrobacter]|jgi:hypothetical protein|uniref:hypothetical protein n=1 Tax=Arthrobacter TaxID=1663 RepID=UPI00273AB14C|nr:MULTISPECIES: hypothetical protein [Arthrobacter]MDV8147374.1 hypothetical protein [Arthrobacter sp. B10-11]WLQ08560.1 hypothetical protein Q8Z05_10610 [Arthrobacter oryzae]
MSEEVMAVPAAGPAATPKHVTGLINPQGSAATRAMREQARRRRDAEAKLQQHLLQTRNKQSAG